MGHGCGAETGFVGEDTAGNTHADGQEHGGAGESAFSRRRREGFGNDPPEHARHFRDVHDDDNEGEGDIDDGHERHETAGHGADALHAAKQDEGEEQEQDKARDPGGYGEGLVHADGDGVNLHEVADAEAGDEAENGEAGAKPLPFRSETVLDEVHGAADPASGGCLFTVLHGQNDFGEFGHHAHEGGYPHPEEGARAADGDSRGHTHDVAGADITGKGGHERVPGGNLTFLGLVLAALPEKLVGVDPVSEGEETQDDVKVKTRAHEKHEHDGTPDEVVETGESRNEHIHGKNSLPEQFGS